MPSSAYLPILTYIQQYTIQKYHTETDLKVGNQKLIPSLQSTQIVHSSSNLPLLFCIKGHVKNTAFIMKEKNKLEDLPFDLKTRMAKQRSRQFIKQWYQLTEIRLFCENRLYEVLGRVTPSRSLCI